MEIFKQFEEIENNEIDGVFELVPGMTGEEMKTMFFDSAALVEPPYRVFQLNSSGHRYYYKFDDEGNPEFYPSVTTIISQTVPKSKHLIEWIAKTGIHQSESYKMERAAYGTFMHGIFERLVIERTYNLDNLKNELKLYIQTNSLPDDFIYNADELKKDILAFAQFMIDYDVRPLAVEIALVHPHYKFAGMIDLPCSMLEKIGGIERINAIVDFKSGKKGFYEDHEIQLGFYRELWNVNFKNKKIDRIFNFAPKDWRKKPSYSLADQTNSVNIKKVPYLLELAAIEDSKKSNVFTAISGVINLDGNTDFNENILSLTLSELIKRKQPKDKTPIEPKQLEKSKEDLQEEIKAKRASNRQAKVKIEPEAAKTEKQPKKQEKAPKIDPLDNLLNDEITI